MFNTRPTPVGASWISGALQTRERRSAGTIDTTQQTVALQLTVPQRSCKCGGAEVALGTSSSSLVMFSPSSPLQQQVGRSRRYAPRNSPNCTSPRFKHTSWGSCSILPAALAAQSRTLLLLDIQGVAVSSLHQTRSLKTR
jgi:hypothetical protein